ncbi:hypothetical protein G4B88_001512, partial [Cannabis sativa]
KSNKIIYGFQSRPFMSPLFFYGCSYLQLNLTGPFPHLFSLTIRLHHQINHLLHFIPNNGPQSSFSQLHTHPFLLHQHLRIMTLLSCYWPRNDRNPLAQALLHGIPPTMTEKRTYRLMRQNVQLGCPVSHQQTQILPLESLFEPFWQPFLPKLSFQIEPQWRPYHPNERLQTLLQSDSQFHHLGCSDCVLRTKGDVENGFGFFLGKKRTNTPNGAFNVIPEDLESEGFDFFDGVTQPGMRFQRQLQLGTVETAAFRETSDLEFFRLRFPVREFEPDRHVGRSAVSATGRESDTDGIEAIGNAHRPPHEHVGDNTKRRPAIFTDGFVD